MMWIYVSNDIQENHSPFGYMTLQSLLIQLLIQNRKSLSESLKDSL